MGAVLRILFLVPIGFVAAAIAGGFVLAWSGFLLDSQNPDMAPWTGTIAFILSLFVGAAMALPMLAAIVAGELFRLRSFFFWTLLGGAVGAVAGFAPASLMSVLPVTIEGLGPTQWGAAGLVFGAVYWLLAGRMSGLESAPAGAGPS